MKWRLCLVSFLAILIIIVIKRIEGYGSTSPGTMVQLNTSHVSTQDDLNFLKYEYPKRLRKDIYDLTESDLY